MARPDSPRVTHFSRVNHSLALPHSRRGSVVPYAGMPVSAQQTRGEWWTKLHQFDVIASLPVTTVGWTITATGAGAATLSDDLFPPHLILTNAASHNHSLQ